MQAERPDSERGARAVLVALQTGGLSERGLTASLDELARLLETAGGVEAARVVQNAPSADPRTYIGSGKAKEIAEFIRNDGGIDLVVFDNELTPSQIRNLEDIFDVRVIDRTMLILDIFALHAVTGEGKLQVEIACLRYSAPRLTGKGKSLSRQGGTSGPIGSRGPGESKLELDRRRIRERISALNAELKDIEKTRAVNRSQRTRAGIPTAAIVGYTNAGKSTLLNRLTDAGILAEDKLFATLDPTTRRLSLPRGGEILLTDTVGFIDRLPMHLVKAFKSTLEEATFADIIVHLVDASEPADERTRKQGVTLRLLEELAARPFSLLRAKAEPAMRNAVEAARMAADSVGGVVEIAAVGLPAGLGSPMFDGVENRLAPLFFGIPAIKGVEFGDGFALAGMRGSQANDPYAYDASGRVVTTSNHNGGILGGITSGMPLIVRLAVKPTASIGQPQRTVDLVAGREAELVVKGRHDPCIVPRALPVAEAALALGLLDILETEAIPDHCAD